MRARLVGELAQRRQLPRRLEAQRRDVGLRGTADPAGAARWARWLALAILARLPARGKPAGVVSGVSRAGGAIQAGCQVAQVAQHQRQFRARG